MTADINISIGRALIITDLTICFFDIEAGFIPKTHP